MDGSNELCLLQFPNSYRLSGLFRIFRKITAVFSQQQNDFICNIYDFSSHYDLMELFLLHGKLHRTIAIAVYLGKWHPHVNLICRIAMVFVNHYLSCVQ